MTYKIGDVVELVCLAQPPLEGMIPGIRGELINFDVMGEPIVRWFGFGPTRCVRGRDEIRKVPLAELTERYLQAVKGLGKVDREAVAEYTPVRGVCPDCFLEVSMTNTCECEG